MKKTIALLILACFILPQLAFGGAWTLPKNNIWMEYYMKWGWTNKFFNDDGALKRSATNPRAWGWGMSPKVEYGVTDWLTVLGGVEYKEAWWKEYSRPFNWGPYVRKNHGLSEVNFGAKARFLKKPVVASGQIKAYINTRRGYDINDREPGISDGDDSIELRGLIGKKWDTKIPFYMGFESGYRWHNRDVPNSIPVYGEFGFWPWKWFLIKTEVDCYFSHSGTGKLNKDYAIWRIGPVLQLLDLLYGSKKGPSGPPGSGIGNEITRSGRSFDIGVFYGNTFWGRNTGGEQEVVLKVSAQY
jgi:hypothetical protein